MQFPLPWQVIRRRRALQPELDELNNEVWGDTVAAISVAGWSVPVSTEPNVGRHERLQVDLELHAPTGEFLPDDRVEIEPYGVLEVVGWPENFSYGPFGWDPGLETVLLKRIE